MTLYGGTWTEITNRPWYPNLDQSDDSPWAYVAGMHLLTDGSVAFNCGRAWYKLTPDRQGSYVDGSWTRIARRPALNVYYQSAMMADGQLMVWYGEWGDLNGGAIDPVVYNPVEDEWTYRAPGVTFSSRPPDIPGSILPDGKVIVGRGPLGFGVENCIVYDPVSTTWSQTPMMHYPWSESGFCLRQDGTVLHYQGGVGNYYGPGGEIYNPVTNTWTATSVPANVEGQPELDPFYRTLDMGPLISLVNGDIIQIGSLNSGATLRYSAAGEWSTGPTMPILSGQTRHAASEDRCAAILPNGNWLVEAGEWDSTGTWTVDTRVMEFDGTTFGELANQRPNFEPWGYLSYAVPLPTGQVLMQSGQRLWVFTPADSTPPSGAAPVLTSVSDSTIGAGSTYTVNGQRLNGVSIGGGMKDEMGQNFNFPIVKLTYGDGTIVFCYTAGIRRQSNNVTYMGIDPSILTRADFTVPATAPNGACTLTVCAHGMESNGTSVTVSGGATYHAPLTVTGGVGQHFTTPDHFDGQMMVGITMPGGTPHDAELGAAWATPSIQASGGTPPYDFQVVGEQPAPSGTVLTTASSAASLVGTPSATLPPAPNDQGGGYTWPYAVLSVEATDADGATGQGHFLMRVDPTSDHQGHPGEAADITDIADRGAYFNRPAGVTRTSVVR